MTTYQQYSGYNNFNPAPSNFKVTSVQVQVPSLQRIKRGIFYIKQSMHYSQDVLDQNKGRSRLCVLYTPGCNGPARSLPLPLTKALLPHPPPNHHHLALSLNHPGPGLISSLIQYAQPKYTISIYITHLTLNPEDEGYISLIVY